MKQSGSELVQLKLNFGASDGDSTPTEGNAMRTPTYRSGGLKKGDKSVAVFYFTGTGNTKWVAGTIEEIFAKRGTNIKTYNIETLDVEKANDIIKNSDICGFGYPVYGSDLPQLMKDFI